MSPFLTGETAMNAITYNWANWTTFEVEKEVEAPSKSLVKFGNRCGREEEFRTVLDSYMADYRMNRDRIANKFMR
jgi:hypothetical protein